MKALPITLSTGLAMPLSDAERQQADIIFAREIYPALKWGLTSSGMPFAYVLGGQPGAGKNRLTQILQRSSGGNMMVINGDDFRRHHPDAESLYARHGADAARYTADFAGYITEQAINRVVDRLAANANTVYRECKLKDFLVYNRQHKLFDSRTLRGLPGECINAELNRLSLNVLSPGNAKLMDEFASRLQETPKMPFAEQEANILAFRKSLLERQRGHVKMTEKKHNRDFER